MPKARKDPNKPKGAKTSFIIFGEKTRADRIERGESIPTQTEFAKELGNLWKEMSKEEKKPYLDLAAEDKKRFQKEMEGYNPPSDSESDDEDKEPKKKKKRAKKDPNAPKRNVSAYFHFASAIRPKLKADNPTLGVTELAKMIGERWQKLTDSDKKPYENLAAKDRDRYQRELSDYNS